MQKLTVIKRFGFNYIQTLLGELGKRIEVVQMSKDDKQELFKTLFPSSILFLQDYMD